MKLKTLASIITLSIIATTMAQASTTNNITKAESLTHCNATVTNCNAPVKPNYKSMTTVQLQVEVEKHSKKDCLPFALGKEMIKRWTKS